MHLARPHYSRTIFDVIDPWLIRAKGATSLAVAALISGKRGLAGAAFGSACGYAKRCDLKTKIAKRRLAQYFRSLRADRLAERG